MLPNIIGVFMGLIAVGLFAFKFHDTSLCRP